MISLIFSIYIAIITIAVSSFIRSYSIKAKSHIIKIEDRDMVVVDKSSISHDYYYSNTPLINYNIHVKVPEDKSNTCIIPVDINSYHEYRRGDIVTVQEIFYKHKNSIFLDVTLATKDHYTRLQEYLNKVDNSDLGSLDFQSDNVRKIESPVFANIITIITVSIFTLIPA